jgi:hypothetical protein
MRFDDGENIDFMRLKPQPATSHRVVRIDPRANKANNLPTTVPERVAALELGRFADQDALLRRLVALRQRIERLEQRGRR